MQTINVRVNKPEMTLITANTDELKAENCLLANPNNIPSEDFQIIEPQWWTGQYPIPPKSFTLDCSNLKTADFVQGGELDAQINQIFDEVGLLHLTNTDWTDMQEMRRVAMLVIKKQAVYRGGSNPRSALQPNVYEVGAPTSAFLHYHHEMAYIDQSATMLGFLCQHALPDSGYTFVSDSVQATDAILATPFGQKLRELGLCYHRNLTDREAFKDREEIGVYNHWQKSMLTKDPDEAVEVAKSRGLETEWGPNRLLKTRYYVSAFEYFPGLDRNLLYSSVADDGMWFDTWPKVMHLPYDERPLKLTFGDGTEMTREEKRLFVEIYDRFGMPLAWKQGDIGIICNYRFAHGRPGIQLAEGQKRELGVIVGDTFKRVGDKPGKW